MLFKSPNFLLSIKLSQFHLHSPKPKLPTFPIHLLINPSKTLITPPPPKMSWECKKCTFLNSPSSFPKPICKICLSSSSPPPPQSPPSSSSSSAPKWSCKACTFLNSYKRSTCEVCDTRAPVSSTIEVLSDTEVEGNDATVGSVFLPLQKCKRKRVDDPVEDDKGFMEIKGQDPVGVKKDSGKYNVFRGFKALEKESKVQDPVEVKEESGKSNVFRGVKAVKESMGQDPVEVKKDFGTLNVFRGVKVADKKIAVSETTSSGSSDIGLNTLKVLTYNVWFREELEVHKRMKAIGDLIQQHCPDVICLQEVTEAIYDILRQSSWWKMYQCSIPNPMTISQAYFCMQLTKLRVKSFSCRPFAYSAMGRELCVAEVEVPGDRQLVVATSHLESPCPGPPKWDQMYSKERVAQAKEALNFLKDNPNVIFCGDMNWCDKLDGEVPLPENWIDVWKVLKPGENGWTYDTKSNHMLTGNKTLQKRLDRFFCSLRDFRVSNIEMIGTKAIPGLTYINKKKVRGEFKMLENPVLPSDHYGLLLTICGQ